MAVWLLFALHAGLAKAGEPRSFVNHYGMRFELIPPGSFEMGSSEAEVSATVQRFKRIDSATGASWFTLEMPKHRVTIRRPFYMEQTEVTQAQWHAVMGTTISSQHKLARDKHTPFRGIGDNYPMFFVSWDDAQAFVSRLNALHDGYVYRLPSEAEWEYAARAGTTTEYAGDLDAIAWYENNSGRKPLHLPEIVVTNAAATTAKVLDNGGRPHPVGTRRANAFGLYDMQGNVWEWCQDVTHPDYVGAPSDGSSWVVGGDGKNRVVRGGAWDDDPSNLRSAYRSDVGQHQRLYQQGFRVVAVRRSGAA